MEYFILCLSFIGWFILSCITLGIGFLWLIPYFYTTSAAFYEEIAEEYYEKNI
ncbi:integral membrane protein [Streptococcus pneumoniae]|nr:integral membrane protein [Streptococcus pneumoniae]